MSWIDLYIRVTGDNALTGFWRMTPSMILELVNISTEKLKAGEELTTEQDFGSGYT